MPPTETSDFDRTDRVVTWAMLAPPVIWLTHLSSSYSWVPSACASDDRTVLHLLTVVAIALTAGAGLVSWRHLQQFGLGTTDEGDVRLTRRRFTTIVGCVFAAVFSLLIVGNEIVTLMLRRCA